jgi:hypothetical protein
MPESGYAHCHCRDCGETIIVSDVERHRAGTNGPEDAYCDGCLDSGCPGYQGFEGMSQECQRADAYGSRACLTCDRDDETYFDPGKPYNSGTWRCERCKHEDVFNGGMPGWTRVKMYPNGSAVVHTGTSYQIWEMRELERSINKSQICCETRQVAYPVGAEHCPCLACNIAKEFIKWTEGRNEVRQEDRDQSNAGKSV